MNQKASVLILGASGMLGSTLHRYFFNQAEIDAIGTIRTSAAPRHYPPHLQKKLIKNVSLEKLKNLNEVVSDLRPDYVLNCVGIIKQKPESSDYLKSISINSELPHRLAELCNSIGAKLIHFSTDCVFSGKAGNYTESDLPDARDLYGLSKLLGEVDYGNSLTLRTSIIGHELDSNRSLLNWFLSQDTKVKGFKKAIFSGLPTVEIARVIHQFVMPNPTLSGLYHLSVDSISKHDLLKTIAEVYRKEISIDADESVIIDRSLNSIRFQNDTGYKVPDWKQLIVEMNKDFRNSTISI